VGTALRQFERALDPPLPTRTTVIVQHVIGGDRALAGTYQVNRTADGVECARIQLALQVGHHPLRTEELLATLAEAAMRLADEQAAVTGVRVPLTLPEPEAPARRRPMALPDDPLVPITPFAPHRPAEVSSAAAHLAA
jgi:hypothetical protein